MSNVEKRKTFWKIYNEWKHNRFFDRETREELAQVIDIKEIEDRFYKELEFGTGGLRGIMGAGTNRINRYTVGKVTVGLVNYLLGIYGIKTCAERGIIIAFDTRNNSKLLASVVANVITGKGIKAYLFSVPVPTAELSFTVKHLNSVAGVVITASHNPKEYNGYKIYDENGSQLVPRQATNIIYHVNKIVNYNEINFEGNYRLLNLIDTTEDFINAVMKQSIDVAGKENLKIIYTPLHGTGNIPVRKALKLGGFISVNIVQKQEEPDGNFSTVNSPNPEEEAALELGLRLAMKVDADLVLGTDPDCDRIGVGVKIADKSYKLLTGNQIGALLIDFLLSHKDLASFYRPAVVKTVVTSELGADIARHYGLQVFSTLTGFKYIGEKITQFEEARWQGDKKRDYTFIIGYEESCGYLAGTHARDKDAVVASLLISEMAAEYKSRSMTLMDRMHELYDLYGFYRDGLESFTLKGRDGLQQIADMMTRLRKTASPFIDTINITDYSYPVKEENGFDDFPVSDLLKYTLADGSWVAIRPSGTEPKIKIYFSIKGKNEKEVENHFQFIRNTMIECLGL